MLKIAIIKFLIKNFKEGPNGGPPPSETFNNAISWVS